MVQDATDGAVGRAGLTARQGDDQGGAPDQGHFHGQRGGDGQGAGRRVLVIEDEPHISEAIRFILRRDGWAVAVHDDGFTALDLLREMRPDVLVLDVMLPGSSGYDILRDIRGDDGLAVLPVILLTAKGQAADRDMARSLGASVFMTKPFSNAELLAAVRQLAGA